MKTKIIKWLEGEIASEECHAARMAKALNFQESANSKARKRCLSGVLGVIEEFDDETIKGIK